MKAFTRLCGVFVIVFAFGCSHKAPVNPKLAGTYHVKDAAFQARNLGTVPRDGIFQLELKSDGTFIFGDPRLYGDWKETSNGVEISVAKYSSRWNFLQGRRASDQSATQIPVLLQKRGDNLVIKFKDREYEYTR